MRTRRRIRPLTIEQLVEHVRREYAALPGLQLTEAQIQKVWGLDPPLSVRVLRHLIDSKFLQVTPGGHYVRATLPTGQARLMRPVRAASNQ